MINLSFRGNRLSYIMPLNSDGIGQQHPRIYLTTDPSASYCPGTATVYHPISSTPRPLRRAMASSPALPELRAKRTHARRSCDVCKIRKTRCELPDLEVPSSQEPLPPDKACHRCKILSLPCVVDDSARKQRKRITIAEYGQPSRPKKPRASGSTLPGTATSTPSKSAQGLVDHTLDIFHGLNPADTAAWSLADALGDETAGGAAAAGGPMPPYGSREPAESWQSKSLKLHGRPLELVCAMLSVAYGKRSLKRAGVEEGYEVDLEGLADADMRLRLEPG